VAFNEALAFFSGLLLLAKVFFDSLRILEVVIDRAVDLAKT
jgi:hypothetical protein